MVDSLHSQAAPSEAKTLASKRKAGKVQADNSASIAMEKGKSSLSGFVPEKCLEHVGLSPWNRVRVSHFAYKGSQLIAAPCYPSLGRKVAEN